MNIPAHLKTQEEIDAYLYAVACLESNGRISPIPPRRDVFTLAETEPKREITS